MELREITASMPEPMQQALAASSMAATLSFFLERKYLQDIDKATTHNLFHLEPLTDIDMAEANWLQVTQVGRPLEKSAETCFTAMQKILQSCFLPNKLQLLFLVVGNPNGNSLYIGLRGLGDHHSSKSDIKNLANFIQGIWPGTQAELAGIRPGLDLFQKNLQSDKYEGVCAITGIPSMESMYKQLYPATVDKLIAGMQHSNDYAYLVVANPISANEVDEMLTRCREMHGQAESLNSVSVTEGNSESLSHSISLTDSESHSVSRKSFDKLGKAALTLSGLGLAASMFPAAKSVLNSAATVAGGVVSSGLTMALGMVGLGEIAHSISEYMPTVSNTTSHSNTTTESRSESLTHSVSRNVVNKHVESAAEHLAFHSKRIEQGKAIGLWDVGVYLLADKGSNLEGGAMQLQSILSGSESIYEPIRSHSLATHHSAKMRAALGQFKNPDFAVRGARNEEFDHPLGNRFARPTTVLSTKELSCLMNFPMRSVPGISVVDSSPEFSLNRPTATDGMPFGHLLYGGSMTNIEYLIPRASLSRHVLLSGINGSGKTNTVKAMLNNIGDLPFLIIEPAKTEYVDWALDYNRNHPDGQQIDIYIPGCPKYKGEFEPKQLKINPFEVVWLDGDTEPNVLTHIDRLKSAFAAAFPMYDILPVLMEDLIYAIYSDPGSNWMKGAERGKTLPPTLNTMKMYVDKVIENLHYEERVSLNMKACLNTRIDSLMRGWMGDMLKPLHSTPWNELFDRPTVINLSYVGDDVDKGFFMSLVLQLLYEYRAAQSEAHLSAPHSDACRHLTVIEEAHRVMSRCENPEMPQYKTAMMFSNILSEIRAYGEGFLLVDQVPTRLIPDAIKNTNLKITHRLVAEDDCRAIGESMGLSPEQRLIIPKLLTGQCVVSSSVQTDIYWVKANKTNI